MEMDDKCRRLLQLEITELKAELAQLKAELAVERQWRIEAEEALRAARQALRADPSPPTPITVSSGAHASNDSILDLPEDNLLHLLVFETPEPPSNTAGEVEAVSLQEVETPEPPMPLMAEGTVASTQVNPFLPAIVNMMMDKSAGPIPMFVDEEAPDLKRGRVIIVHGVVYKCVGEPWHYPAGKVVTLRQGDTFKTIKVSSESLDWEVSVLELLGTRLRSHSLQGAVSSFVQVEAALRFRHSSFIITQHHPYGSIQDSVARSTSKTSDCVSLYLTCELVTAVAALHQCKILHTAIAPHNVMIRDMRMFQDVRSALGHGVCLVDFSTAVDLSCFPDDVTFVGSGRIVCPQMKEGKPWKWQVDYYGIAMVGYQMLTGGTHRHGELKTGPLPQRHCGGHQLLNALINAVDPLPLMKLVKPLQEQLVTNHNDTLIPEVQQYVRCQELCNFFANLF